MENVNFKNRVWHNEGCHFLYFFFSINPTESPKLMLVNTRGGWHTEAEEIALLLRGKREIKIWKKVIKKSRFRHTRWVWKIKKRPLFQWAIVIKNIPMRVSILQGVETQRNKQGNYSCCHHRCATLSRCIVFFQASRGNGEYMQHFFFQMDNR